MTARFADVIREARQAAGLDLAMLAAQAGWTTGQLQDAEAGRYVPGTDQLFRLAVFLGLDPVDLGAIALADSEV